MNISLPSTVFASAVPNKRSSKGPTIKLHPKVSSAQAACLRGRLGGFIFQLGLDEDGKMGWKELGQVPPK